MPRRMLRFFTCLRIQEGAQPLHSFSRIVLLSGFFLTSKVVTVGTEGPKPIGEAALCST